MAEAPLGLVSRRSEPESPRPNPLRSLWLGITCAAASVTSALLAIATVTVLAREPRLFTIAELVPPDESLVGAYLPGAVALGVALVLAARLRWIPAAVRLEADGLSIFSNRKDTGQRFGWGELTAVAPGSRWEGSEVHVATGKRWFVSRELADAIERGWHATSRSAADR
jgi:hypothetical protein